MASCNNKKGSVILNNKSIEETKIIAHDMHSGYCIVLLDSTQILSRQYREKIENSIIEEPTIYNLVDINIPENEWFLKWLCPISLPLTCVFSKDGNLLDLIPGSTRESLLYANDAMSKECTTDFHYINRFDQKKEHLIPILNHILKCSLDIRQGVFVDNSITDTLKYPYPYYLKILGYMINNDTISAINAAEEMLMLENSYYLDLYNNEFVTAKTIVDPNFDVSKEPNIRVNKDEVILSYLKKDETYPFDITIFNDGEKKLEVSKIYLSCTCLKLETADHLTVSPKDSVQLHFLFKPDQKGDVFREIFITSNAINTPIQYIKITARECL